MAKIAIIGAGIYGSTIAISLAKQGMYVDLFDPNGVLNQTSSINQFRVHAGYHYPRSTETIDEIQSSRISFKKIYKNAIFKAKKHIYAIPFKDTKINCTQYEQILNDHNLSYKIIKSRIFDKAKIEQAYEVEEELYDPDLLRKIISHKINKFNINLKYQKYKDDFKNDYDFIVWCTYGFNYPDKKLNIKYSLVEKCYFKPPSNLEGLSVVIIDGPFTAFDTTINNKVCIFGSAKYTNIKSFSMLPSNYELKKYRDYLNKPFLIKSEKSNFQILKEHGSEFIPKLRNAEYLGSKFTFRVTENNPNKDNRILHIDKCNNEIYVFSGKIVSCIKAANEIKKLLL
ncbi:FAD-dependent oxidoreductase [Candidatus Methylopumilus universalis]|uniref:FAD-dependent oxidoreductase n=1 Tax=Candidatus Methylopumilus universalis TaxID=2588536 RepID=UPI00111CDCED|nr:FAD-dependent oxidoreductase [Candidatus Methylopumilus universalis]QDC99134.1 FAD-dependent oxidoreductase [Candidatus Methylopumilus universalis]